jgi:hypothetical protein
MAEVETTRDGGVLTITLNRPEVLNAFTAEMHRQLVGAFKEAREPEVRAVVLTGAGRGFCVGQDLNEFKEAAKDIAGRLGSSKSPSSLQSTAPPPEPASRSPAPATCGLPPTTPRSSPPSSTSGSFRTWAAPTTSVA